jgi:hypothetical protein
MDKERLKRNLEYTKKKHENDKLDTFDTDISMLCFDTLNVLDNCIEIPNGATNGDVLKVGGIKEKIIGAVNNNFKKVFIPMENKNDLDAVPDSIKSQIDIVCVNNFMDVYNELFKKSKKN